MGQDEKNNKHTSKHIAEGLRQGLINRVADFYLKGYSYRTIAKMLEEENEDHKISIVTIGKYVGRLLKEWKEHRIDKLDDLKTVELTRINRLENTYWEGWERSLTGMKRSSEKQKAVPGKVSAPDGQIISTMNVESAEKASTTEDTFGDPRFLAGIQWCIGMRCKILGIEAPIEFSGKLTSEIKRTTVFKTRKRERP